MTGRKQGVRREGTAVWWYDKAEGCSKLSCRDNINIVEVKL